MKKTISLNSKEIKEAVKWLQNVKKKLPSLYEDLLTQMCKWIIEKANKNIDQADLGENVKDEIKKSWAYTVYADGKNFGAKIINTADKAVFVEFGTGIVGEGDPHPNASTSGYEYNVESEYKDDGGSWHFFANEADLDIPRSAIEWGWDTGRGENPFYEKDTRHRMSIYTNGAEGVLYAYNALMDIQQGDIIKGMFKKAWERVMK